MTQVLTLILGGLNLPVQAQLIETTTPLETDIQTLDGTLYTDFIAIKRSWSVLFPNGLCGDDFNAIYAVYRSQYPGEMYLSFFCAALSINTIVKCNISDKNIRWNGNQVDGFSLTLKEKNAIS